MASITYSFICRNPECGEDLTAEIDDVELGHEAFIAQTPEASYPGEGPRWTWPKPVTCECGAVHDEPWMELNLRGGVMDELEAPEEGYDEDEGDDDDNDDEARWR